MIEIGDDYFKAYGECLRISSFDVSIRVYEDMPKEFQDIVDKKGIVLYERKKSSNKK